MLFLVILILSVLSSYFLPWWTVAVVAFLAALFIGKTSGQSFLFGFSGVFVAWVLVALFKSLPNDNMLAERVVQLFPLPHNWICVLLVTGIIGGLIGAMGALSGALLKKALAK